MDTTLRTINALLPLLYLGVVVGYGRSFLAGQRGSERIARPLLLGTLALHLLYLVLLSIRWQQFPAATISQAVSALAFAIALVYVVVEHYGGSRATGVWLLSVALLFELLAALLKSASPPHFEQFESPLFALHVSLALIGYAGLVVAACYGFLYLRVYADLKHGRFSRFFGTLPPLEVLDRMMVGALVVGTLALGGAVISGGAWADQLLKTGWQTDPKIVITLATLIFYGSVLVLRRVRHLHGRPIAFASLVGFGALLFSLLAVNLLFSKFHGFQ